jgi:hypothetical protein
MIARARLSEAGQADLPVFVFHGRLDNAAVCSKILLFEINLEDMIMRIVMINFEATRLRDSGGALLPWSQCAWRWLT